LHSLNALHGFFGIVLQAGARYLAGQRYGVAVHAIGQVIENAKIGKHHQFVANFLVEMGRRRIALGEGHSRGNYRNRCDVPGHVR